MGTLHRNALLLLIAHGLRVSSGFAVAVALGRSYGAESLGMFGLFSALYLIAFTGAGSGLKPLLSRDIARSPERASAYFTHSLLLGLGLSLLLALLLGLGAQVLDVLSALRALHAASVGGSGRKGAYSGGALYGL